MERILKNDKELMNQVKEAKRWKKIDFMNACFEIKAVENILINKYHLNKEDAKEITLKLIG